MKDVALTSDLKDVFTNRVWSLDTTENSALPCWKLKCARAMKVIRLTLDTFAENRMGFQCVALSYFVALATIPLLAFVFSVSGGLGMTDKIAVLLYKIVPDDHVANILMNKAGNIIDIAKSSMVGFISAAMLVWTILWLFFQIERVFNNIWGIRRIPRKMFMRFGSYIMFFLCLPFLFLVFSMGIAFYTNATSLIGIDFREVIHLSRFLAWVGIGIITICTFTLCYKYIPVCYVDIFCALKAAIMAGIAFTIFQFLYLKTQIFMTRLNLVYGALAAIPLFLIWVNFSWQIMMYGAQLSYSLQHVSSYRQHK